MAGITFYEYESMYDIAKGEVWIDRIIVDEKEGRITRSPARLRLTRREFYRRMDCGPPQCARGQNPSVDEYTTALTGAAERRWYETDATCYKVAPAELPGLVDCDIDVPTDMLRLPYESIVITLPVGHEYPRLIDTASGELRTIMASHLNSDTVVLLMDTGARGEGGLPMVFWYSLALRGDRTIEEEIAGSVPLGQGIGARHVLARDCVRIAAAVVFMATGADRQVEVDVLTRDVDRFYDPNTTEAQRETMRQRARRRKHCNGFIVGRDPRRRDVRLPRRCPNGSHGDTNGGRRLRYRHRRCGHWRYYRAAGGCVRRTWVRTATVRCDLPPHPDERGYAVGG